MAEKQVSNKILAILIIVTLLVTIISTWLVLLKIDRVNALTPAADQQSVEKTAAANLAITILPKDVSKNSRVTTGNVVLNVN